MRKGFSSIKTFFVFIAVVSAALPSIFAQPAQIVIIRHAEKPNDPEALHLSAAGEKRARELVRFVKTTPEITRFGLPAALFATRTTQHGRGQRTQETLEPLAKDLQLEIRTPFKSEDAPKLAASILSTPEFAGKTVLVCWTHESIPPLIKALGINPPPPPLNERVYDRVYLVTFPEGKAMLREINQTLPSEGEKAKKEKDHHPSKKHKLG